MIALFVGDDIAWAGAGDDEIRGDLGADILFGEAGADVFDAGAGLDVQIGGAGNDVFIVDLDCEVEPGEVIDGGPGTDTVKSHRTRSELESLGLTFASVEVFTLIAQDDPLGAGTCDPSPFEEGPFLRPKVVLTWDDLPDPDSVVTTSAGIVDLNVDNTSAVAVTVDLTLILHVAGWVTQYQPSTVSLAASASTTVYVDLSDFIPGWVDPEEVDPEVLELRTSASLLAKGDVTVTGTGVHDGQTHAPVLYGHLEGGEDAVVYREQQRQSQGVSGLGVSSAGVVRDDGVPPQHRGTGSLDSGGVAR